MQPLHLLLALIANFAWGFNFIAGKIGANHFHPLLFTGVRFFFLLLVMLPWLRPAPGYMKPLLRVAFCMGVLHFSMMFIGLNAGANIASIAITTQLYVPFSAIFAAVFLKEKIAPIKILAIVIAFFGILVIGFDPIVFNHLDAVVWVIGAALAFSVGTIQMRQFPNMGILTLQAWIALVAAPSLFLLSLFFETGQVQILSHLKLIDLWTPLYSALGASVIGHSIVYYLLGRYTVSTVTPLMLLAPVIASLFGVWYLGDQIGWRLVLGGFLTLTGILLVSLQTEKLRRQLAQFRNSTRQRV